MIKMFFERNALCNISILLIHFFCGLNLMFGQDPVWEQKARLSGADQLLDNQFGRSLAISGNFAIVGARKESYDSSNENTLVDAGCAYIFEKNFAL